MYFYEDKTKGEIQSSLEDLSKEITKAALFGKRTLIFAYFASHGCVSKQDQHMILNQTSGVLLNVEQEMKNLVIAGRG